MRLIQKNRPPSRCQQPGPPLVCINDDDDDDDDNNNNNNRKAETKSKKEEKWNVADESDKQVAGRNPTVDDSA